MPSPLENVIAPRQISETTRPVLPSFFMRMSHYPARARSRLAHGVVTKNRVVRVGATLAAADDDSAVEPVVRTLGDPEIRRAAEISLAIPLRRVNVAEV